MKSKLPKLSYPTEHSIRIEKIANGYLSHHTKSGDGVKNGWQQTTVYHRKMPLKGTGSSLLKAMRAHQAECARK